MKFLGPLLTPVNSACSVPACQSPKICLLLYVKYTIADFRSTRRGRQILWATMRLLEFELRTFRRAVSALNHCAISSALVGSFSNLSFLANIFIHFCLFCFVFLFCKVTGYFIHFYNFFFRSWVDSSKLFLCVLDSPIYSHLYYFKGDHYVFIWHVGCLPFSVSITEEL